MFQGSPSGGTDLPFLIQAARAGNSVAFSELIGRSERDVLALLGRQVKKPFEVDELFQEVAIRAYLSLPCLREPERFHGWLMRIAYFTTVDWIRRQPVLRRIAPLACDPPDPHPVPIDEGGEPHPERCLPFLVDEIARLQPMHAAALLLRGLEGMAYNDIADLLQISMPSVKTYLHRARLRLRNRLAAASGEDLILKSFTVPPVDSRKDSSP